MLKKNCENVVATAKNISHTFSERRFLLENSSWRKLKNCRCERSDFNLLADFLSESVLSGRVRTKLISISIWNLSSFETTIVQIHYVLQDFTRYYYILHYHFCMATRNFCFFYSFFLLPKFHFHGYRSGRKFMLKFRVIAYFNYCAQFSIFQLWFL